MVEFNCGSPVCKTHFAAPTMDELMGKVARHVVVAHRIPSPTKSLVEFVVANCITETPTTGRAG
jgi:predicted small metal-binding protein